MAGVWLGKLTIGFSRLVGWGGSTLPGRLARRLEPELLRQLGRQVRRGNLIVTGTNGKTTTSRIIAQILDQAGLAAVHNRAGANLLPGLTAAYLEAAGWNGRVARDIGLLEVDEASVPRAVAELNPTAVVVTNFFRDQLDRYGELDHTVNFVRRGLEHVRPGARAVLNADDPRVAHLTAAARGQVVFYGIEDETCGAPQPSGTSDARNCVSCGEPYRYSVYFYAHLGKYRCPRCGHARPRPEVALRRLEPLGVGGTRLSIATARGEIQATIKLPGLYNAHNALAAAAAAYALGIEPAVIASGLESFSASFGRMETIAIRGVEVFLALVKNPAGFDEVLRTLLATPERKNLLIAINDNYADGTDVSWLWDVNFEWLAERPESFNFMLCSGIRAEDMAVRLKYAGVDPARIAIEKNLKRALLSAVGRVAPGEMLYLLPTYTAMLEMRRTIARLGYARHFWEV